MATATTEVQEIAFYYPGWIWRDLRWIKNWILFFDGVGLLVPEYMLDRPENVDPSMVSALRAHGLLQILKPEELVDTAVTQRLATAMTDIIVSGALDHLATEKTSFHELSYSRMGGHGDPGLAKMIIDELKSRGLARDSEDGVSIPLHPQVRALVLVLLAQILSSVGSSGGRRLCPATDLPRAVKALQEVLSVPTFPSAGHVVSFDLQTVGVDLSDQPIEDILEFREKHRVAHRDYARDVRKFMRETGVLPLEEQARALQDRQEELTDRAADLQRISVGTWGRAASVSFGLMGAILSVAQGNPLAAILSAGWAVGGGVTDSTRSAGAYTYVFNAQHRFPAP